MLDFEVDVTGNAQCTVVRVRGELDIATAPQLLEALDEAYGGQPARLVVDLLRTSFIDSTGLTTLFRAHKRVHEESGGDFSIVCGPDNVEVRRVIDLMGFDTVFVIHESLSAAGCEPDGTLS